MTISMTAGLFLAPLRLIDASGSFAPSGPPVSAPVRVDAGGSCVVDLSQEYSVSGTLSGAFTIDYRIIVRGPCDAAAPGRYDEDWIAHGTFAGTAADSAATATFSYLAHVQAGGDVQGKMVLEGTISGELTVSGNFKDGKLAYTGRLD